MLERLELKGFEGYRYGEVEFSPGLNLITGRNSTGKTTLLDAVLFALYGEAPGVDKKMLVSRLTTALNRLSVRLAVKLPNGHFEVWRTGVLYKRGGKEAFRTERLKFTVNGRDVPLAGEDELRRKVSELMGMGLKKFLNLVYVRQGELTGILKPKREDMDFILGINVLREVAEQLEEARRTFEKYEGKDIRTLVETCREHELPRIKRYIGSLEKQIAPLEKDVSQLEQLLEKAKSDELKKLLTLIDNRYICMTDIFEKKTKLEAILNGKGVSSVEGLKGLLHLTEKDAIRARDNVEALKKRKEVLQNKFDGKKKRLDAVEASLKTVPASTLQDLEVLLQKTNGRLSELEKEVGDVEVKHSAVLDKRSKIAGKISSLRGEVENHRRLLEEGAAECPTCGQKIAPELLERLSAEKEAEIKNLEAEYATVDAEYKTLDSKLENLKGEFERVRTRVENLMQMRDEIKRLLDGDTLEGLREACEKLNEELEEVNSKITEEAKRHASLENKLGDLKKAFTDVNVLQRRMEKLKENLKKNIEDIAVCLQALSLPFNAEDPDLKSKVAEKFPLSPEEIKEKEKELKEKKERLKNLKVDLEKNRKEKEKIEGMLKVLEERSQKAKMAGELAEKLKAGIEKRRKTLLNDVQRRALNIYNTLTNQHIYKAFRINPDTYEVYVQPAGLAGFIPATRVGGGHQTLIALAVRMAILDVLEQKSLLILDEPTYGVDSENLPQLISHITEMARSLHQVLLVTHYGIGMEEATNIIKVSIAPDGSSQVERAF